MPISEAEGKQQVNLDGPYRLSISKNALGAPLAPQFKSTYVDYKSQFEQFCAKSDLPEGAVKTYQSERE